jgi:ankyrin repeat protein
MPLAKAFPKLFAFATPPLRRAEMMKNYRSCGTVRPGMSSSDAMLVTLIRAIVVDDWPSASRLLNVSPALASASLEQGATRRTAKEYYLDDIEHYLYAGDTLLHGAAAAYRAQMIPKLVARGAEIGARNRRGAQPLHYAVDGVPGSREWNPRAQRDTVVSLLDASADPDAVDKGGVTPLHRAVRTRCAAAVSALLEGGANPRRANGSGSTPMQLATWTTGRGGSGSPIAKAQQEEIVRLLVEHGADR